MAENQLFISYSRANIDFVTDLVNRLKEQGVSVWFDRDIPSGSHWDNTIEKEIKAADTLVIVLSKTSVASQNVLDEASYAIRLNKRIIPIQIEECEIPMRLARYQFIDFTKDREAAFERLIADLGYKSAESPKTAPQQPKEEVNQPIYVDDNPKKEDKKGFLRYALLTAFVIALVIIAFFLVRSGDGREAIPAAVATAREVDPQWDSANKKASVESFSNYIRRKGKEAPYYKEALQKIDSLLPDFVLVQYRNNQDQLQFHKYLAFNEDGSPQKQTAVYSRPKPGDLLIATWDLTIYYDEDAFTEEIRGWVIRGGDKVRVLEVQPKVSGGNAIFMRVRCKKFKD
ncbi:toll/interleukin-1 receptor domain-containing protein [Poritiphilus flavus]|uniref:TIR domain-containing protein n=1 Tax=Poritiphilus flavus TaxID=2697053 RepID=A0A6L9EFY9_9FLAO|nr:toll/interleukin-1 receptor domain-containing protein [Poritiphilus flavus]NAS13674.1 TIR domain-containing protein [Poritiphilus flavus]